MIGKVTGKLIERHPPQVIVDVHGIGYEIDVPMSTFYQLPATGNDVTLYTHLVVREDAHLLYGFASEQERYVFRQLLKISGVGARTALSVLSGLSVADLYDAVSAQDSARLIKVPGIGKKTAERLLLELKDKLDVTVIKTAVAGGGYTGDILNALLALGYNDKEAAWAVKQLPGGIAVAEGIRQALKLLSKS
jgi:Holliday junction DNA helicase RuvA